jgi:hypothetical protein
MPMPQDFPKSLAKSPHEKLAKLDIDIIEINYTLSDADMEAGKSLQKTANELAQAGRRKK